MYQVFAPEFTAARAGRPSGLVRAPAVSPPGHVPESARCPDRCGLECRADHQFVTMLRAYHATGGLARAQELIDLFQQLGGPDVATLSCWIEHRDVVSFDWHAEMWLPLFQFSRIDLLPQAPLGALFSELNAVFDGWELANWLVRTNPWLAQRIPVDVLVTDLPEVVHAARAERFIANG